MSEGLAKVNDAVALWYEAMGDPGNAAIVLSHPGASDALWWPDEFCQMLVEGGRFVIRYDMRDYGLSSRLDQYGTDWATLLADPPYSWEDMATDAVELLDHLGIDTAHFVGFSAGSVVSNYVGINHPGRCSSLTLMGTFLATHGQADLEQRRRGVNLLAFDFLAIPPETDDEKYEMLTKLGRATCGSVYPYDEGRQNAWAASAVKRGLDFYAVRRAYMSNINATPRADLLPTMQAPTLVIQGMEDTFGHMEEALVVAALVPDGQFLAMTGMGHQLPTGAFRTITTAILRHTAGQRIVS